MPGARDVAGRRYALAVMEMARQSGTGDHWSQAVDALDALTSDPRFVAALQSDGMTDEKFQGIVRQVMPDITGPELNLLRLLRRKNRLALGTSIASYYRELRDEAQGVVRATVRTAVPLEQAQRDALARQLSARTGGQVELSAEVDPDLLGGAVIRIGDHLIDGSVRTRLRRLREQLMQGAAS